jgi:tripartite-type tricarboxylate transporter receptor subunit TctC
MNRQESPMRRTLLPALILAAAPAFAWPTGPVQFVVPWPPGDLEDILTRMIAEDFQAAYGQPAAVINKPGGGGGPFPGAIDVATGPTDGSVIGSFVIDVPLVGDQIGIAELDPMPFEPVGIFLTYPFVLATSRDAPFQTLDALAAHARGEGVVLGHFGAEIPPTQVAFALAKRLGFDWGAEAAYDALDCNTLASGDVDVITTTIQQMLPCMDRITILASVTEARLPMAPDAPTVAEVVPELSLVLWNGLFVRKQVGAEAREKIAAVARATMASERAQTFAADTGAQIYWQDAAEATARIAADRATLDAIGAILGE